MLFVFISKHAVSPQSVLPKSSTEVTEKCPAGRSSLLKASFQHLCLFLIIFHTSENLKTGEETPCLQCVLCQNNQFVCFFAF